MAENPLSYSLSGGISLASIPMLEKQLDWEDWIRKVEGWIIYYNYDEPEPTAPRRT